MGSPPHTRGILGVLSDGCRPWRFTPAYAGNTLSSSRSPPQPRVHPRIRGEYIRLSLSMHPRVGSPPHTRGILYKSVPHLSRVRFTPAYAGNTSVSLTDGQVHWVHPRIRGEYIP